ncbi:TfoX/Sxy family DNA transformation protein [Neptuniibacter sp. QD48_11]|uniref:TfoX/Sxy family DNA transformation protein n=1 Tax=unclassified Neptuniibacter TaxID=2630693 RepID=UPI0039F56C36
MRNIGPVSRRWLAEIEIYSLADLEQVGPIATYKMIKSMRGGKVSINLLWALVGALEGIDCRDLSPERKAELRELLKDS